ncbi:hypothetical protein G5714_024753 [Onychostoma macrolepis]|uniref:Uncharacterized protein n=1 Tax=Onychostoma macrolepis TaxID=369639 RepID=A0A7J6BHD9_9TELE|nr:hypothetical protein G5714_024753 [Onychostoma macrolepis]
MRGVEMARGPHHLGESSQERRGVQIPRRASGLVLATAAHILKLIDTEKISMAPAKDDTQTVKRPSFGRDVRAPLLFRPRAVNTAAVTQSASLTLFVFLAFLPPLVLEKAEATPPFALSTVPRTSVSSPFLGGCRRASLWNWARTKPGTRRRPVPKLGGDCVSQAGPAPAAQHLHGMRCRDGSPGPTTLVRARRNARGTDTSAGQQSRARHGGTYTKIGSIQKISMAPAKDDTQTVKRPSFGRDVRAPLLFASSREYRRQRPRPLLRLAPCHGQACPAPSFGGCRRRHFGIGHVQNLARGVALSPNSAAIVSVRRVQPQQPSTCTAEATPPFCASTPMPRTRVSSPFLRRMPPCVTLELGTCTKPGTRRRPVPKLGGDCVSQAGPAPAAQHLHEATPLLRLALDATDKGVQPLPSADAAVRHFGIERVYKTWHAASPCPPNSASDCVSQAGPAPAAQHLHGMRGVEMARGPHHLGESSQEREGYRYLGGPAVSCFATAAHILKLDRYRRLAWPLRKDDTQIQATPPFCASTPVPRTSVSSPFLRRMPPCVTLELGTCTKPGTRRRPVPKLGGDCVSQAGPAPAAQHLHGMRCRDGSPGPTTLAEATPPFCASTPMPRTRVSSPFLRRMPPSSLWNWARVQNLARGVALSPKLGGDCVSQAGPAPAAQHLHGMRGVEMARGPHHLGESSQEREGYRYLGGPAVSCSPRRHIY